MKKSASLLLSCLLLITSPIVLKSQDTLFMKNGVKVATKILEISPTEIKYKKTDNLDGPVFTTHGSDISLIKYQNGSVDTIRVEPPVVVAVKTPAKPVAARPVDPHPAIYPFGPVFKCDGRHVNAKGAQRIMLTVNDPTINDHVKKAKTSKVLGLLGFVAIPTFIFGAGYTAVALLNNNGSPSDMSLAPGIASGAVAVVALGTSITFNVRKKKNMDAAIDLYNAKY